MSDEPNSNGGGPDHNGRESCPNSGRDNGGFGEILGRSTGRIRNDPLILLPFALAGIVLSIVDALRLSDPIPTSVTEGVSVENLSLEFAIYPTGTPGTSLPFGALVDLKSPYLLWALGLEIASVLAVSIAGWYTLTRVMGTDLRIDRFLSYTAFVVSVIVVYRVLGGIGTIQLRGLFGLGIALVVFVLVVLVFVRLFVVPAFVVAGNTLPTAVVRSARTTRGNGVSIAGVVLFVGIGGWILGSAPLVGAFLSTLVIAPLHAVAIVVCWNVCGDHGPLES